MRDNRAETVLAGVVKAFKEARLKQGLSHEVLAQRAGLTRPAISHIESGKRKPTLIVCLRIAHALDLKLWQLMKKVEK